MILLKHNAIDNFTTFTKGEKEDLIIQELSKAFMLYPRATADILDTCEIKYKSLKPKDLALAVEQGRDNLKMLNRIVRLSFLVNRQGDNTLKNHNRNVSFRRVMSEGKPFLEKHRDAMKEATLIAREMMNKQIFSKALGQSVDAYAALDGGVMPTHGEEKQRPKVDVVENKPSSKKWLWIVGSIIAVGGIFWWIKSRKSE
jgi:hypothetical protein